MVADIGMLAPWLKAQWERGCEPGALMQAMLDSGWSLDDASRALLAAGLGVDGASQPPRLDPHPLRAHGSLDVGERLVSPGPSLFDTPQAEVWVGDRHVKVLMTMAQPRMALVAGLLDEVECAALIDAARSRLHRSQTVSAQTGNLAEVNVARTSEGMFFAPAEIELVGQLESRIATLLDWPVDQAEGLQVLRYAPGAEYRPHFDHFDARSAGGQLALQRGGQRVGTLVIYLAAPEEGGATQFPDLGLAVQPQVGHAIFFGYDIAGGDPGVLHGGAPVVRGEKWVATKWLREKKFS